MAAIFPRPQYVKHQTINSHKADAECIVLDQYLNTLRLRENGRDFPDYILKCIFLNEKVWISIKISLKFVPEFPINNILALVQIKAWRRPGNKPLSETMLASLLMHICFTWPQWVNLEYHQKLKFNFKEENYPVL